MDISHQKRLMRRSHLALRARIGPQDRLAAGSSAARRVLDLPEVASAEIVLAFASFGSEITTQPLVAGLLASGRRVTMPYVDGGRMAAAEIGSVEDLAPGYRGISEPKAPRVVAPVAQVIVVPGVAFDADGRRLGYGGGFYDEFLDAASGLRIGLCFECQITDRVPVEPHDLSVSIVVTEATVRRVDSPGSSPR